MENKRLCLGILAIVLVFGITFIGCDTDSGTDSALNGSWRSTTTIEGWEHIGFELQISNGNWEIKYNGSSEQKGTANNGSSITTHIHGYMMDRSGSVFTNYEYRWYSQTEAQMFYSGADIGSYFSQFTYSINSNVLTWNRVIYIKE